MFFKCITLLDASELSNNSNHTAVMISVTPQILKRFPSLLINLTIIFSINRLIIWSLKHQKTLKGAHHNFTTIG